MYHENLEDAKKDLLEKFNSNKKWYRDLEVNLVIAKQDGKNYLYRGKAIFRHFDDPPPDEVTYDYGFAILARRILSLDEFLDLIEGLSDKVIQIKDLKSLEINGSWENTVYPIPSRTRYVDIIEDWPVRVYHFEGGRDVNIKSVNDFLVKTNCPTYPTLTKAAQSFLNLEEHYFNNNPFGMQFELPDFRARIKTLEISEKNINISIDIRETKLDNLVLKVHGKDKKDEFNPNDIQVSSSLTNLKLPFVAKELYLFLVDKRNDDVIDLIEFGNYMTERHEGIVIKTPSELIEDLILSGENKNVEFKQDMSKDEFLETISSFSNSEGGRIILGVDNRKHILGFHDDFTNLEKSIRGTVSGRIEPHAEINVEQVDVQNKPLIVITVKEGKDKPYLVKGKSGYVRVDERDISISRIELDEIYLEKKPNSQVRETWGV